MTNANAKVLKVKNELIGIIIGIMKPLVLDEKKSSARRRFTRILTPYQDDMLEARKEIQLKYGEKDPEGNLKIVDKEVQIVKGMKKHLDTDWKQLNEEVITIFDVMESNKQDLEVVTTLFKDELAKFEKEKESNYTSDDFEIISYYKEVIENLKPVGIK